jgi:hypothetical protein
MGTEAYLDAALAVLTREAQEMDRLLMSHGQEPQYLAEVLAIFSSREIPDEEPDDLRVLHGILDEIGGKL